MLPPHLPRQVVAVAVLLTGFGQVAAAAAVKPAAKPAATRTYQAAPFHASVPVISYYNRIPLLPATITDAQAQALVQAGIVPYYHQAQGPGRTIPLPGPLLNQFHQRELFLNALIGGVNKEIAVQVNDIFAAARLAQELRQFSKLIGSLPLSRDVLNLRLYKILSNQLRSLDATIALNDRTLMVGIKNELTVFKLLNNVAPLSPDVSFYRIQIIDQQLAINFLVQETETPIAVPPLPRNR